MIAMTTAALLAFMGGDEVWVAPLSWLNDPKAVSTLAMIPKGEYHTFVVGNAVACRVDAPDEVEAEVFIVKCYPKFIYGKWDLRAYYMPTAKQSDPSGLWAVRFKANLPPGKHKFIIHTAKGDAQPTIGYEFQIVNLELPPADIPFGMFYITTRVPPEYGSLKYQDMYLQDMVEHGMTTVTVSTHTTGQNEQVKLFRLMQKYGLDRMPAMLLTGCDDKPIAKIDGTEFLLYGPDEPSPDSRAECEASLARARGAGMRHVTAISAISAWSGLGSLFDIWVVHPDNGIEMPDMIAGGITPTLQEYAKQSGASIWHYHCGMRGTNPKLQRYYSGLFTWAVGAKGCFRWAYVHDKNSCIRQDGTWNALQTNEFVLPTPDGPMPTVGWEGVREGVLDYRIIRALEKKVINATGKMAEAEKTAKAALWLARLKHSVDPRFYGDFKWTDKDYFWDRPDVYDPGIDLAKMRADAIEHLAEGQ